MINPIEYLQWRYATKKFDPTRKLPEDKINILKEAFNLTATSYGLQPIKLIVVKNQQIKEDLKPLTMNQIQVQDASHVLIFCVVTNVDQDYISNYFELVESKRGTAKTILAPFKNFLIEEFKQKSTQEKFDWAKNQAYLAMGNLLTICAIEKIDACPIEGFEPQKYDDYLNLKEKGLKSVLVMPIGYRAKDDLFADLKKVRKDISEIVINFE